MVKTVRRSGCIYLTGGCGAEGDHVRERRDDVDGEADEEGSDGGVDGPEEGEDDGEEPDGHDDGEARGGALAEAAAVVEADELLPHEVERRAGEAEGDELVDEHEDHGGVAEAGAREEGEGVGVVQERVAEGPVHGGGRRQRQRQHVQRRQQVDRLELLGTPHRVHDLPAWIEHCSVTFQTLAAAGHQMASFPQD